MVIFSAQFFAAVLFYVLHDLLLQIVLFQPLINGFSTRFRIDENEGEMCYKQKRAAVLIYPAQID